MTIASLEPPFGCHAVLRNTGLYWPLYKSNFMVRFSGSLIVELQTTYAKIGQHSTPITESPSLTSYKTAGSDVVCKKEGVIAMQPPDPKKLILPEVTYLPSALANRLSLGTLQQR